VARILAGGPGTVNRNRTRVEQAGRLCYARRDVNPKRLLLLLAGALLLLGLLGTWLLSRRAPATGRVSGTIETDEVRVASRYGGRVENVLAQEGDTLKAGQLIVELDAAELLARREQAAALLEELLRGPRPEEIAAAKADWEALVAQLDFARAEERRAQELFEAKTISATEREQAASRARALEKSVAAARQRYELLLAGTRPERIAQARARLAEVEAQLREMRISSPCDCVLETLHVKPGDVVAANGPLATLLMRERLWVRVYVPESWLGHIRLGQEVTVRTDSPRGFAVAGTVEQINRQAEFTPRNVQTVGERVRQVFGVKVRLPADTGVLRAGMAADVIFPEVPPLPR
jgi:HlyD family secretion protein